VIAARRTKILATLGPATDAPGVLDDLMAAGLDCVRLNCSHGTADELRGRAAAAREAAGRAGRALGVLLDLQGPKLRLAADTAPRVIAAGDELTIASTGAGAGADLVVDFAEFLELVTERSEVVIGDGLPRFTVIGIEGERVRLRAARGGSLGPRKGVNVTYAHPRLPAITAKDVADLELAAELEADFVALSFVRGAADVEDLRDRLAAHGSRARTIAKIEKIEAYDHLDEILAVADGVMVARGDYGVEAGVANVPLMQKDTIFRATQLGRTVITATQMLESMIHAPEPTRAEATDVANAVIDGTSAVMLSAETGVGEYPVEAVRAMSEIAHAAESAPEIIGRARGRIGSPSETVLHAAEQLACDLDVAAIVIPTATGGGVRVVAKYRPDRPVVALCHDQTVANQLTLEWGVIVLPLAIAETVEELVDDSLVATRDGAGIASGEQVVITVGQRTGTPGATSLIMVREIP
jgi:pyruvate kinase